ncbi:hypothetical protein J7M23_11595, partial [Candidatus Sumerlaeota bacterium]|nr:hypothetical protein [Candidatus Sumerlaeota bacterium]
GFINYSWFSRVPEGWVYLGTLQTDVQTYTAIFRELFENGNGFFYGSPNEIREFIAPPIFIQLPFIILGWLWHLSGFSIPAVWELFRIGFTFLFCISLALLLRVFIKQRLWFLVAFVMSVFGSGSLVFLIALLKGGNVPPTPDGLTSFLAQYYYSEQATHWWGLHLFRTLYYPVEIMTHSFFFLTLYFLLRRRLSLFTLFFFLTWFTGVFTAIELSAILVVFLLVELLLLKDKKSTSFLLTSSLIILVFLSYYKLFIPAYPVGKSLDIQHRQFPFPPLTFYDYITHYAWLLLFLLPSFFKGRFWHTLIHSPTGRLLLIWIGVVFLLTQNDKFLPGHGIQPPHFLRGYLFLGLSILVVLWFSYFAENLPKNHKIFRLIVGIFLVIAMVDSFVFTLCMYNRIPHPEVSTIRLQTREILDYLNTLKTTRHILVLSPNRHLDVIIPAQTPHRSYLADVMATPFWDEKFNDLQQFLMSGDVQPLLNKYHIDTLIVRRELFPFIQQWHLVALSLKLERQNTFWQLYTIQ